MGLDITGLGAASELITTVVNKIWPDKSEQEKQDLAAALSIIQGQLEINREEAKSNSLFVSGWRPFVGWVCGVACAWNWIGLSLVTTLCSVTKYEIILKAASLEEMFPVLLGLLGLGTLRTYERAQGVQRSK